MSVKSEMMKRIGEIEKRIEDLGGMINSEEAALKDKRIEKDKLSEELKILLDSKGKLDKAGL